MSFLWAFSSALLLNSSAQHRNQEASSYSSHLIGTALRTGVVKIVMKDTAQSLWVCPLPPKRSSHFGSVYSLISCLYHFWLVWSNWFHKPLSFTTILVVLCSMSSHVRRNRNIDVLLIIVIITGTVWSLEVTNEELLPVCLHLSRVKPPIE